MSTPQHKRDQHRARLSKVPQKPGVYLMRDRLRRVIYVGKAKNLRKRLRSYFVPSKQTLSNLKTRALIDSIWDFEIHTVRNETEALLLEGKLIKDFRPRYNISFRDDKRFYLVKLNSQLEHPYFELVRHKKPDGAKYIGPFAHSHALRGTIEWLNKRYGLRTCRARIPTEADYKHCHADIIRNCSAPCIANISQTDYQQRVDQALAVLEGKDKDQLERLKTQMHAAAESQQFERAADLRDIIQNIETTIAPSRRFTRGTGTPQRGNPIEDLQQLQHLLRLETPPLIMECFDISNVSDTYAVASMVRFVGGKPDKQGYRRYRIKTVDGQNDFAAMAEVVRRRYRRILAETRPQTHDRGDDQIDYSESQEHTADAHHRSKPAQPTDLTDLDPAKISRATRLPDLIVVDGGKGQLSSAYAELRQIGIPEQPIIGIAKREEEIYRPGVSDPLVIPHNYGALKLLQRLRDEAHRTANGYHQLISKRRVRESLLDAIEGLGPVRKQALLSHFGSVERIKKASPQQLTDVHGISDTFAHKILQQLNH